MAGGPARHFGFIAAAGLAVGALAASPAQAQAVSERKAMEEAAAEYLAEAYPLTDALRQRALGGQVMPYCRMNYPETGTLIDDTWSDLPSGERAAIAIAVDAAFVRQSLVAAGMDGGIAGLIAQGYRSDRETFAQKSDAQRAALVQSGEDPAHNTLEAANFAGRLFGLPKFQEPENCNTGGAIALPVMQPPTPYRFVTEPPGAEVFILRRFTFRLCEKRFEDPYARQDCKAWKKVPQGSVAKIAGDWQYSVEWPDGGSEREFTTFEFLGSEPRDIRVTRPAP